MPILDYKRWRNRMIYNIIRFFLYGIIFIVSLFKKKTRDFFKKRLLQKIRNEKFKGKDAVLVHLSSVGEFNLSQELIKRMIIKGENIIISVMTDTGFAAIEKVYANNENIKIIYFPLDDYFLMKKLFKEYNIKKTVVIETEIWPNLYSFAYRSGELFIVNGRLTEKRLKSYMKVKRYIRKILNLPKKIMVQSYEDKKRYERLGVEKTKLITYKNLKYSIGYEKLDEERKKNYFAHNLIAEKKKIVCGSTRPGEEEIWLEVFKEINVDKEYQLVIVPRHLERIREIEAMIEKIYGSPASGLYREENKNYSLLSENRRTDILIVDKMGVLRDFYQLADFVFVGGTLVNIGGHSILEPLYYGKLPIIGKYYQNIEEIVKDAEGMGFVKIVKDKEEILEYLEKSEIINTSDFFNKNNEICKILEELY